jgi:DNA polymerase
VTTLATARPVTGAVPPDAEPRLAALLAHLIDLAKPKRVLVMGQAASRALLGPDGSHRGGRLETINPAHGTIEVLATWSPRFLLEKPAAKAEAWKHLQLLIGGEAV